jgi:EKC/KEOPS complex subunit PCC1/LAGE3
LLCQAITEVLVFLKFRHFAAVEARFLRASFSAFVDLMGLVTKLVEEYGVAMEEHS